MYVSKQFQFRPLIREALIPLAIATAWSVTVVYLHEFGGLKWIILPVLPVTLVGIAVSLFVAFKNASAYNRWWEARTAVGLILAQSRELVVQSKSLVQDDLNPPDNETIKRMLMRHLGWLFLAAHLLRRQSGLKDSSGIRIFSHRSSNVDHFRMHQHANAYQDFLDPEECSAAEASNNAPFSLMLRQAQDLRRLAKSGLLDPVSHVAMVELLGRLTASYGICERIKFTPFPRQVTYFGRIFTWLFIFMLPLAFLDVFDKEAGRYAFSPLLHKEYVISLVPFSVLVSWIFLMMEKVSESHEDPFEGGIHDVPLSAILRLIEIDVKQALQEEDVPAPLQPIDDILY